MRIAFKNRTIHECARVAFVSVADDIFLIARLILLELPLHTGRETGAAASAEAGSLHDIDNILRGLLCKNVIQSLIAVNADILINVLRIDASAVAKSDSLLLLIETDLVDVINSLAGLSVSIEHLELFDDMTAHDVLLDDTIRIFRFYMCIVNSIRINGDDRSLLAEAEAACLDNFDLICKTFCSELLLQSRHKDSGVTGCTSGTAADKDIHVLLAFVKLELVFQSQLEISSLCLTDSEESFQCCNFLFHAFAPAFFSSRTILLISFVKSLLTRALP